MCLPAALSAQSTEAQVASLIDSGAYAQAFNQLEAFKAENSLNSRYYALSARLYFAMNSFPEALTNIYSAVKLAPKNSTNFLIMGNTLRQMGLYPEARTAYNTGVELDSGYGQFYYELAQLSFLEQKLADAERALKLSQNFNPNSWVNEVLSSKLLLEKGRTNDAERRFLEIASAYPQDAPVLQELANFYASQKKYDKAVAVLKEATMRFGENISRALQIGDYTFQRGAYNEAQQYYSRVLSLYGGKSFSGSALVHWRLSRLALQNGQTNEAETNLRSAFEQNPENQLYISEFSRFLALHYPPGNSYRGVMGQFLGKLSQREMRKGYGAYYLSLLYKQTLVDPFNPAPYKELLNYAKINQDESAVPNLIKSLIQALPDDQKMQTSLRLRQHLASTGRLDQKPRHIYAYKTVFFIEDTIHQSAPAFAEEIVFYNSLFPKMDIQSSDLPFATESRNLFREGKIGMAVHVQIKPTHMEVRLFDKNGGLIRGEKLPYSPERFTENILSFLKNINNSLAPLAYLDQRLPNNIFKTGIGVKDGLRAGDSLSVYDAQFVPVSQLSVIETLPYSSTASIAVGKPAPLGNGTGFYVFPSKLGAWINPLRLFIPEGEAALDMDPFNPRNQSLDNLRL